MGLRKGLSAIICVVVSVMLYASISFAAGPAPGKPSAGDKCPVCGMFVAKYRDFVAQVRFKDGSGAYFDGVKDMLKYHGNPAKYDPRRKKSDITAIYVTDYYSLKQIDGFKAYYVVGSDVYGPMGNELISFGKKEDAAEFMTDHRGKRILTFREIDAAVMKSLE